MGGYITVLPAGVRVGITTKCFRMALANNPEQGVGWSEIGGSGWIFCEARVGTFDVFDTDNQHALIMLDSRKGKFYRMASRQGPAGSNINRYMVDRYSSNGYEPGTEIPWKLRLKSHTGSKNADFIKHLVSHLYVEPQFQTNRNASGHDSQGYRNGLVIGIHFYVDDNPTESTEIRQIPIDGDLMADKFLEGHTIAVEAFGNSSEVTIKGATTDYEMKDKRVIPEKRFMKEHDLQEEFALPFVWMTRGDNLQLNRASGVDAAGSYNSTATGPDGFAGSAFSMVAANSLSCAITPITGDFTIQTWIRGYVPNTNLFTIGTATIDIISVAGINYLRYVDGSGTYDTEISTTGAAWALFTVQRSGNRLLVYENGVLANNIALISMVTLAGSFVISGDTKTLFDVRGYENSITAQAIDYYWTNVAADKGNAFIW